MKTILLLFSGGKDSFIATCREIYAGNRVVLISFNNSAVIGEKNILHGVARLQRKYGKERIMYAGCYNTGAIIQSLKDKWADMPWSVLGEQYPNLTNTQITCLHCQTAMWIAAIAYAQAKGILQIDAGYKQSDPFCTGLSAFHQEVQALAEKHFCKINFPVLDDRAWVESPGGIERNYEMSRYGFIHSVYEPKCMLGRPAPPMTPEMQLDMAKYFANDLRQVAEAEIEQMIPVFRTIQLTPESMPVLNFPLPDE